MHYLFIIVGVIVYTGTKLYQDIKAEIGSPPSLNGRESMTSKLHTPEARSNSEYVHYQSNRNVEKNLQHHYTVASTSLILATVASLFFPVLMFVSVVGIIYTTIPIWQTGYRSLVKEHRFDMAVVDSILFPWLLFSRYYFVAALLNWICYVSKTFSFQVKKLDASIRANLINIFGKLPKVVWLLKDGAEIEIPCDELNVGDVIVVSANGIIPVDGVIVNGTTLIDQRILTGEHKAREKRVGDQVFAATVVLSDRIFIRVGKFGSETVAAQLLKHHVAH